MEPINTLELRDQNIYPDEQVLIRSLGDSFKAYTSLLDLYANHGLEYEWRYYNDGKAWLCKVQLKKRTIVWMSAWKGFIQATIYFPERLINEVLTLDLEDLTLEKIRNTKNVGKSKPCIFEIHEESMIKDFERIMRFKIENK